MQAIHDHARGSLVDCVIVNTAAVGDDLQTRYAAQKARPVDVDADRLIDMGMRLVEGELLAKPTASATIRNAPLRWPSGWR